MICSDNLWFGQKEGKEGPQEEFYAKVKENQYKFKSNKVSWCLVSIIV